MHDYYFAKRLCAKTLIFTRTMWFWQKLGGSLPLDMAVSAKGGTKHDLTQECV